ncbi:4187_t:CDS:2 [Funneliformis mosseae]|uniref:4187_t:CDS:1 n=1 Tax=Funneliformis mosseae TaxID=27381 RepID=A0A9N9GBP0_FUNMO|nr:4187_t:CDS:2 [Funneliformis mosseae]
MSDDKTDENYNEFIKEYGERYIAKFGCYYDHEFDSDKMVKILIQAKKKNVSDFITAFSDYLS